jgi:cytochrome c oxidase assembly protein subunit 15
MTQPNNTQNRRVAVWLLICCGLVFAMVVLGGVTRLTGSGLSMVDWRPIMGVRPPMSDTEWSAIFAQYRESPEFQKINYAMDVHAFKTIFWYEYLHRLLGRTIGIVFLIPFLFFSARGYIRGHEWPKYLLMFGLGGMQGVLGWYMVKSGLVDNPHVSQYRLTAHLIAAFLIYAYMFWVAMSLLYRASDGPRHRWYRKTLWLAKLITLTVISGGFVAGLKAGLAYNTFPLMAGKWIPPGMFTFEPVWRNVFDNVVTVQFNHRVLAITTFILIITYWYFGRRQGFPKRAKTGLHVLLAFAVVQVSLGISTLLLQVPVPLAAAHQATALLLFTAALYLCQALRGTGSQ